MPNNSFGQGWVSWNGFDHAPEGVDWIHPISRPYSNPPQLQCQLGKQHLQSSKLLHTHRFRNKNKHCH